MSPHRHKTTRKHEPEIWERSLHQMYRFASNTSINKVSKKLKIDGWHPVAQVFFYLGLIGSILVLLSFFNLIPWYYLWIYVVVWVLSLGFIFAKSGQRYRITYVFGAFVIMSFFTLGMSRNVTMMLSMTPEGQEFQDQMFLDIKGADDFVASFLTDDEIANLTVTSYSELLALSDVNVNPTFIESYSRVKRSAHSTQTSYERAVIIAFRARIHAESESIERPRGAFDFTHLWDDIQELNQDPFVDFENYMFTFMDVFNWIVFLIMVGYVGAIVGNVFTLQFDKAAQRAGIIALTVAVMSMIYGIFTIADVPMRTLWDTIGVAFENFMRSVGLMQLDTSAEYSLTPITVHDGLMRQFPILLVAVSFGLSLSLRKSAFQTVMFVKELEDDGMIEVKREWTITPGVVTMLIISVAGLSGYFLIISTGEEPIIQLMFYIGMVVILLLIGTGDLIVNEEVSVFTNVKRIITWTIYGLMLVYLWFLVFQPVAFEMGWISYESSLITLSQDNRILTSNAFEQFFTVAAPETLIFQVAFIGVAKRLYFQFSKNREIEKEHERLRERKKELREDRKKLRGLNMDGDPKDVLAQVVKYIHISQEIDRISLELKEKTRIKFAKTLIPGLVGAIIGSVLFSTYHSFRMGITVLDWWQNPLYGMTFFGAGMILSFVAMFSYPAAILVHFINNMMALFLAGGGI